MKVFISGVGGFVGLELAVGLRRAGHEVCGCDNFIRPGSQLNQERLEKGGVVTSLAARPKGIHSHQSNQIAIVTLAPADRKKSAERRTLQ